jgi:zinc-binding in reverse transcriptase
VELERVSEVVGPQAASAIIVNIEAARENALLKDKLIWLPVKSGNYTTKQGYQLLQTKVSTPTNETCPLFQKIWQWKLIPPRVKMFIWRTLHDALPTMHSLHKRINSISPRCQRCGSEDEYLMQVLFYCSMIRG